MSTFRKIQKSLKLRGVVGTAQFMSVLALKTARSLLSPAERRARATSARAEETFDQRYNVDTRGFIPVSNLDVNSSTWMEGNAYQGVGVDVSFARVLGKTVGPEDFAGFTFIDLGSGKGRAVLLAARLPFHEVVGVEFSAALHSTALKNLECWPRHERLADSVSFVCADAADFPLPDGPVVVFLYNPFGAGVIARVAERVGSHESRVIVVYFTPKHAKLFDALPRMSRVDTSQGYVVWDSEPDDSDRNHLQMTKN